MNNTEQTLSIIKPDAVERDLVDKIQKKFVDNHFKIIKVKKFKYQRGSRRVLQSTSNKTLLRQTMLLIYLLVL